MFAALASLTASSHFCLAGRRGRARDNHDNDDYRLTQPRFVVRPFPAQTSRGQKRSSTFTSVFATLLKGISK